MTLQPSPKKRPVVAGAAIGTAGWSIPATVRSRFPAADSLLERYAGVFGAVEINSSFYRPHQGKTYARWAAATPGAFRFSVKAPREITHLRRLAKPEEPLERFLDESSGLGVKRGVVLIQLPPSLPYDAERAETFFQVWRGRFDGLTALEPRHASWFAPEAEALLSDYQVARVAADPAPVPAAAQPGGWSGFRYHRLHGSPTIYESPYSADALDALTADLRPPDWVIFDNTKFGAATENALDFQALATRRAAALVPEPPHAR